MTENRKTAKATPEQPAFEPQPKGLSSLDLAAYLLNDGLLQTKVKLALLRQLRVVAQAGSYEQAKVATELLRGMHTFDRTFREHWYPALLAGGVDHYTDEDTLAGECDDLIAALADVPRPPEPADG